ncbi:Atp-dependent protease subunit [Giardia duodenalis]|uniref:Atp-dependent protease subunit n=1 Tax=Giardia intestinalis TaxID=5741 RepID=V6TN94_GIAIN|nr:Atp-dependent protease subunit [Giardia intestinalis]
MLDARAHRFTCADIDCHLCSQDFSQIPVSKEVRRIPGV